MPSTKKLSIRLKPCCKRSLREIGEASELGTILKAVVGTSPLLALFGSGPIEITFSVATTDWSLVERASDSVDKIAAYHCEQFAQLERLRHPGGDLQRFWRRIAEIYGRARLRSAPTR